ncbi:hypothetical protein B0T21DRAFT_383945 [Apiosordaria backusii]|uniref:Uncharacterized protein n=1 Tax=Apiosordaria backusii TaxID=314023 RepID=A0AA40BLF7_9PEZI|nr:hypothetical protein B0T21DRAFT_383945 [Apiosordaria backusii]
MSSTAHRNGNGNVRVSLASQAGSPATAYPGVPDDIYREVQKNMLASLERVRQDDIRKVRDAQAADKAALEQEQMEYTHQFFQLKNEMIELTNEERAVDVEMAKLEKLMNQARQKKQDVMDRISMTQRKFTDVQALQHRKHADLQELTRKHEKDLKEKEKTWEQLYQQRLGLMQSKKPSPVQSAQYQHTMVPDQANADVAAAAASLPMQSLRAPQLAPGPAHQSAGQGGMYMSGPVQPPTLKAPTDNGPRESSGLPASKRLGASVLEAPALPRNSIENQRAEGGFRPPPIQKSPVLQAPVGYHAPFPQPPISASASDTSVPILPTIVPSVESPDEQTAISETEGVVTQAAQHKTQIQGQEPSPPTTGAINGSTDHLSSSKKTQAAGERNDLGAEANETQETIPEDPSAAEPACEDQETEDVEMTDVALPRAAIGTADVRGKENVEPSVAESLQQPEPHNADVEMADNQVVEKQPEVSPATATAAGAINKLRIDAGNADAGPQALMDTADSPLSDLSSISPPPSDAFTRAGSPTGQPPRVVDGKLCVYDEDGKLVGEVRRLTHTTSPNIEKIAAYPLKRHVQIRSGRKFTSEDLDRIYHVSDVKGTKWTSCYIQATGEVQAQPCNTCAKHNGPYEECIILHADDSFPKCGNCEWNRHACVGASSRPKTVSAPAPAPAPSIISKPSLGSSFTAVNSPSTTDQQDNASIRDVTDPPHNQDAPPVKKPARKSLPTSRVQLPSQPGTPRAGSFEPASPGGEPLPEITKENLCLRDDGTVYTAPPFMVGVPLAKISPDHPYWENDWDPDIASHIQKDLEKWTAKFQEMDSQGVKDHRKYEAQRQINRGQLTLKFLEEGELHPYQLVGKPWMEPKKITKYNTLYRLASTLIEDLPKFDLGMTPAEWMRHRLCEIYQEQGPNFNLASTVASFYHDPKHAQVRTKNGFVSVGRPHKSASKPKVQPPGQDENTPKQAPRVLKRKEPHSTPKPAASLLKQEDTGSESQQHQQPLQSEPRPHSSPRKPSGFDQRTRPRSRSGNPPPARLVDSDDEGKPTRTAAATTQPPQLKKKIRLMSTADPANTPDLHYQGFTDVDSCSDDKLERIDWRINQIKTAEVSTNPGVTQYWHWVDDHDPGFCEHQVLKQLRPPRWAVFKEPYNFHLKIVECEEIVYGPGSLRVIIRRKPHLQPKKGDMLAEFKRDRTKKRFLEFMHQKGVRIVRSNKEYVENSWENLKPTFDMPGQEDRDSE